METKKVVKPEPAAKTKVKKAAVKPAAPEAKNTKVETEPEVKKAEPKPDKEAKVKTGAEKIDPPSPVFDPELDKFRLSADFQKGNEGLAIIKAKLRRKYHQLQGDPLDFINLDQLKAYVCKVLGLNLPELDNVLIDL